VHLDGPLRDAEAVADLLVRQPLGDQLEHFPLPLDAGSPVVTPSVSAGCTTARASRSAVFAASLTASRSASRRAA
jgi:hypothetical protein